MIIKEMPASEYVEYWVPILQTARSVNIETKNDRHVSDGQVNNYSL
jgi:hypothetical protein